MRLCGIKMPLLSGGYVGLDVPVKGESPETAMQTFGEAAHALSDELWARRKAEADHGPWLQKATYHYIQLMIQNGFTALFEERITNYNRGKRGPRRNITVFQKGLLALFAHDKGVLQESERAWYGKRLWYAYKHYVPHPFVIGFLKEVWGPDYEAGPYLTHIEPDYEEWLIIERAMDETPGTRGRYPAAIERKVELARLAIEVLSNSREPCPF